MLLDTAAIANAISTAPAWALLGLTVPQERRREDTCRELACHLLATLHAAPGDAGQLTLGL